MEPALPVPSSSVTHCSHTHHMWIALFYPCEIGPITSPLYW